MKNKDQASGDLEGFLTEGTSFQGEVSFHDTLRIDGKFQGAVRSGRRLIIGESADVDAEIQVAIVTVAGRLRGRVKASERVELQPTARAECTIECEALVVHEGARFDGQCAMSKKAEPRDARSDNMKNFLLPDSDIRQVEPSRAKLENALGRIVDDVRNRVL